MATGLRGTVGKLALKFPQKKDPDKRDESGRARGESCVDSDDIKSDDIILPGTSGSSNECSLEPKVSSTRQREVFCKDAAGESCDGLCQTTAIIHLSV